MKTGTVGLAVALACLVAGPGTASAATWEVDPAHTSVLFHIRHLFTEVTGRFQKFDGEIVLDEEDPGKTRVSGTIDAASIDTNNEKRDRHLRSADFFDVEKHPEITFRTTKVSDVDREEKTAKLHGILAIHGVEKPVVLEARYLGRAKDPWGNERAGFRGETTIDRKDFGLRWNEALETGGFLVGDEVRIEVKAEGILAEEPGPEGAQ